MKTIKHAVSKFETKIPANDNIVEIELREITCIFEKMYWLNEFCDSYEGETAPISMIFFKPDSTFFVAIKGDIQLGFVRVVEKNVINVVNKKVSYISEIYVKPAFRHKQIAEKMIQLCVANLRVKMIYLEEVRAITNRHYFENLGFNYFLPATSDLGYLMHKSLSDKHKSLRDHGIRIAA